MIFLTTFVNIGGENLLAVRVDATGREGWWYEGGGIYRSVWLEIKEDISAADNGVFVYSDVDLEKKSAVLNIQTEIENKRLTDCDVTVEHIIYDADEKEITRTENTVLSQSWDNTFCKQSAKLESSNSGTRGCYSTNEITGQYYILDGGNGIKCRNSQKAQRKDMGESEWKYFAERDYLAGIFLWTGMDYRGEPTPLAYPAVYSQFGIFDYCGFPKDNFYYYKSWWTDEPTLHIFPHWNFNDGEKINVHCYSNLDEVELFVNGKSYGRQKAERNWYLTWENVVYETGEVVAKGYKDGKEVMTKTVRTTDAPYKIEVIPYKNKIAVGETVIINVRIADKNGITVPTADNQIFFTVEGGQFLGCGNGNPGSHESDKIPVRRAFNGLCQLLVKADSAGVIKITAQSIGLIQGIYDVAVTGK